MIYTKEQLQGIPDGEVNEVLHKRLGRWCEGGGHITYTLNPMVVYQNEGGRVLHYNYCNNPSDIMPLAFEYDIAYLKNYNSAYCGIDGQKHKEYFTDKKPLRAIACCLILVLQENNNV